MTASQIVPFLFESEHMVRTVDHGGEPWFVAADVCRIVGLANITMALRVLDEDEKCTLNTVEGITDGRAQAINLISEPGIYKLVGRSRKPEAKRFDRWVRHEVLPAIRKTGAYGDTAVLMEAMKSMQMTMAMMSRQIEDLKAGFDNRITTINYITAAEVVAKEGVREKALIARLSGNCATSLKAFCNRHNRMLECRERTGDHKTIFSEEVVSLWLASAGRAMIRARLDKFKGQGALKLTVVKNDQ